MASNSTQFLGQLVPWQDLSGFKETVLKEITQSLGSGRKVQVWVASANDLKVNAAKKAVTAWTEKHFNGAVVEAKGFDVKSDVPEQPHPLDQTETGARNRLRHLKEHVKSLSVAQDVMQVFVSMENGLNPETVKDLRNGAEFLDKDGKVWIDRCLVVIDIHHNDKRWEGAIAVSEGVTTPIKAVNAAKAANWEKTAGSFIATMYSCNAKDWHGHLAGKSREPIMLETIKKALGL